MSSTWIDDITPASITGFGGTRPDAGSGGVTSSMETSVSTRAGGDAPGYSPDSGLFWFAGFALLAAGLIVVSTKVDVGPVRVKAKV